MLNLLMQYRVRSRLLLLGGLTILGLVVVAVLALISLHASMLTERKAKVLNEVETAVGIIGHYQALAKAGTVDEASAKKAAVEALRGVRYNKTDYFFILNTQHVYQLSPTKPESEGKSVADVKDSHGKLLFVELVKAAQQGGGFVDYYFNKPGADQPSPKISYATLIPGWDWVVGTGVYIDDINSAFLKEAAWMALQLSVLVLLFSLLVWQITRSILQQLGGEPTFGISIMNRVAEGDLLVDVGPAPAGSMLASLGLMVTRLRELISEITRDAHTLSQQAGQVANSSREIALASGRQADATTTVASSMEQLTVSISLISSSSGTAEESSVQAAARARDGVSKVGETTAAIEQISGSVAQASEQIRLLDGKAREIASIAAVIKEIAGQTNLLALNAAIEAARAGEQGRGFAVVADEVRKLAERTSAATVHIEQMLGSVQSETQNAVGVMNEAMPQIGRGVEQARGVAELLNEICQGAETTLMNLREVASATREQNIASNIIATRIEEISQMAEETSTVVHGAADSAAKIESVAGNLSRHVSRFRI